MRQFLLQLLAYSLFILTFQSCKSFEIKDVTHVSTTKEKVENLYFDLQEDYVYKGQIEVYGNDISGILIIKKISPTTHRVVMTTDFGNKMLDFEISPNDFKVNYIVPDMDKSMVKNFLEKDFRILLKKDFKITKEFENQEFKVYSATENKATYYLYFDKRDELLKKLIFTENNKEKINFDFDPKTSIFANKILLQHKDIKLKIGLQQITEQ